MELGFRPRYSESRAQTLNIALLELGCIWPLIEPVPLVVEAWSPNHWTDNEFPSCAPLNVVFILLAFQSLRISSLSCSISQKGTCSLMEIIE